MSALSSTQIVRLLAEPGRRRVFAALVLADGPLEVAEVGAASGVAMREVVDALDRLVAGGLVRADGRSFSTVDDAFSAAVRAEVVPAPPSSHADQPEDVARVLDTAFRDGKLLQWPAKRSKRLIVLDHMAQQFDIGKRYSERDVNDLLRRFDDDVATMRRYLIDEHFLDRSAGQYWRCGGTV